MQDVHAQIKVYKHCNSTAPYQTTLQFMPSKLRTVKLIAYYGLEHSLLEDNYSTWTDDLCNTSKPWIVARWQSIPHPGVSSEQEGVFMIHTLITSNRLCSVTSRNSKTSPLPCHLASKACTSLRFQTCTFIKYEKHAAGTTLLCKDVSI